MPVNSYARLGLIHDLNPSASGGSDKILEPRYDHNEMSIDEPQPEMSGSSKSAVRPGYGRIIRDEAGNVIGVELHEEDEEHDSTENGQEKTMEDMEPEVEERILDKWATNLGQKNVVTGEKAAGVLEGEQE